MAVTIDGNLGVTSPDFEPSSSTTPTNGLFLPTTNALGFATNSTERLRLDASGNLGIGTSSPTAGFRLDAVGGAIRINEDGAGTKVIQIRSNWAGVDPAINVQTNNSLLFATNGTERARIDSSGNLLVGVTSATSGGGVIQVSNGITFPSTQSASSNANTLDDYEEGTWTPTVGGNATYTVQNGSYTKIGRMVYLNFDLRVATLGTGSAKYITGLPFAQVTSGSARNAGSVNWFTGLAVAGTAFYLELDGNGIYLGYTAAAAGTISEPNWIGNNAGIMASIWYVTNT